VSVDRNTARSPKRFIPQNRYKQAEEKNNDRMTMKFLLHKDKEEYGKPTAQKQECGCPSLQPTFSSHTHAFFLALAGQDNNKGEGNHLKAEPKFKYF